MAMADTGKLVISRDTMTAEHISVLRSATKISLYLYPQEARLLQKVSSIFFEKH